MILMYLLFFGIRVLSTPPITKNVTRISPDAARIRLIIILSGAIRNCAAHAARLSPSWKLPPPPIIEELKNYDFPRFIETLILLAKMQPAIRVINRTSTLGIDLVDACNLACRTCPRGLRVMKNHAGQMPLSTFEKIIRKAHNNGINTVELYNGTEPFLCQNLEDYTHILAACGLKCVLSSNLSLPIKNLIMVLRDTAILIVSVSGFAQDIYSVNHRGGNIEQVKNNLRIIAQAKRDGQIKTNVHIRYFNFPYAVKDYENFKKFADELGLSIALEQGGGNPQKPLPEPEKTYLSVPGLGRISREPCAIMGRRLPMDMYGDCYVCCALVNSPLSRVGNFLQDDFEEIEYRRFNHPYCQICPSKNSGVLAKDQLELIGRGAQKHLRKIQIGFDYER